MRVRIQAQEEREAQKKRKEEIIREMQERRARVAKDRMMIHQSRIRSVRHHEIEILVSICNLFYCLYIESSWGAEERELRTSRVALCDEGIGVCQESNPGKTKVFYSI